MASAPHATLQVPPLTKQNMAQLIAKAKRLGVAPEDYAKRLLEDGLSLQREAEESTFAEIMEPVRRAAGIVEESDVVKLVEKARAVPRRSGGRGKKR
jgi:hypothetical protein